MLGTGLSYFYDTPSQYFGELINSFLWRPLDSQVAVLNLFSKVPEGNQTEKPKMRTVRQAGIRLRKRLKGLIIQDAS